MLQGTMQVLDPANALEGLLGVKCMLKASGDPVVVQGELLFLLGYESSISPDAPSCCTRVESVRGHSPHVRSMQRAEPHSGWAARITSRPTITKFFMTEGNQQKMCSFDGIGPAGKKGRTYHYAVP